MIVLAFLTDLEVVGKILKHLGLPIFAPALTPARSSGRFPGFALPEEDGASVGVSVDAVEDSRELEPIIRPPP
jgi:hypothetical protein